MPARMTYRKGIVPIEVLTTISRCTSEIPAVPVADEKARNGGEGLAGYTRPEILQSGQIVGPQIVYDTQGELWDTAKHSYDKAAAQFPKLSPHIDQRSLAALAALLAEDISELQAQILKQR